LAQGIFAPLKLTINTTYLKHEPAKLYPHTGAFTKRNSLSPLQTVLKETVLLLQWNLS